ncbi:MAG: PQQ-binding-like beta-propeller repeat protein [Candidatus Thermoplasmatota archaeon]|nr:PQQ-binding-like beta-propeller repeat protein [Candidatus Thermoplasmatota archaeon]
MRMSLLIVMMLLLLPSASAAWTGWRGGPSHPGTMDDEPPAGAVLRWRFETSDQVLSSPSFFDSGLLIGSDDGWLYCLDPLTGELNWKFKTGGSIQSTPLIVGDRVYFGSMDGMFYCLQIPGQGGRPRTLWSYECGSQILSSAHLFEGSIIFGCLDGSVLCLHENGSLNWRTKVGNEIWATPLIDEGAGRLYVGDVLDLFAMLDIRTGDLLRTVRLGGDSELYSSGTLHEGVVYMTTGEGKSLIGLDAEDLSEVYRFDAGHAAYSTPAIRDGMVYFGSFMYTWCLPLDDDDGVIDPDEVVWSFFTRDEQGGSSPLVLEDVILIGSDDYNLYCLKRSDGSLIFNYTTRGYVYSSPVLYDGAVFFGSCDWNVYSVGDPGSGALQVLVEIEVDEVRSDELAYIDVTVLDSTGATVPGASILVRSSGGEALDTDIKTGSGGKTRIEFDPFPVSSRSTIDIMLSAEDSGRAGRTVASLAVEPGDDAPSDRMKVVSPFRPYYIAGILLFIILDIFLLCFLFLLRRRPEAQI